MLNVEMRSADFRHAIALAKRVTGRSAIPVLEMVRCRANGAFEAAGTDLDIQLTARVPRSGKGRGEFLIGDPAAAVAAIGLGGDGDVSLRAPAHDAEPPLSIASGPVRIDQTGKFVVDDWPVMQTIADPQFAAVLGDGFIATLRRVAHAMSSEETRYYLNGVFLHHVDGWNYRLAATDGHRMAVADLALPGAEGVLPKGVILHRKLVQVLIATAGDCGEGILLRVGRSGTENAVTSTAPEASRPTRIEADFSNGAAAISIVAKPIDGVFPDYSRVIPTHAGKPLLFSRAALLRAVRTVACGRRKIPALKIEMVGGESPHARVSMRFIESAFDTAVEVPCAHDAAGLSVGFNGKYLIDALSALGGDEVVIAGESPASPFLIENPADTAFRIVLMPVRL